MPPLLPWLNCESASGNKLHRGWRAHFNDSVQSLAVYKGSTPHVLDELLPPIIWCTSTTSGNVTMPWSNRRTLPEKKGHLSDKNFIVRLYCTKKLSETYYWFTVLLHF